MSDFVIYLRLEPYLTQWLIFNYGNPPIVFPKNSVENDVIEFGLTTKKDPKAVIDLPGEGMLAISLPYFKFKDVRSNYMMTPSSKAMLTRCLKARFAVELWQDLYRFRNITKMKQDLIWAWMESHGIELTEANWNAICKIYDRKRNVYRKMVWRKNQKKSP